MATRRITTTTTLPAPPEAETTLELASTPVLDVDQQLRVAALLAAATAGAGVRARTESIITTAQAFEAYLRGDQ